MNGEIQQQQGQEDKVAEQKCYDQFQPGTKQFADCINAANAPDMVPPQNTPIGGY